MRCSHQHRDYAVVNGLPGYACSACEHVSPAPIDGVVVLVRSHTHWLHAWSSWFFRPMLEREEWMVDRSSLEVLSFLLLRTVYTLLFLFILWRLF